MVLREYVKNIRIIHQASRESFEPFSAFVVPRRFIALTRALNGAFQVPQAGGLLGEIDLVLIIRHVGGEVGKRFLITFLCSCSWVAALGQ